MKKKSKIEKIMEKLKGFHSKLMPKGLAEIDKNITPLEKIVKPIEALNKLLYIDKSIESLKLEPLKPSISDEDNEILSNTELPEITNAKNINKLVEIVNKSSKTSEDNAKTANKLAVAALLISVITLAINCWIAMQPIKIDEQQFNKLINKPGKGAVSVSQIINYSEPSTTSTITISRKLTQKNKIKNSNKRKDK